MGAPPPRFDNGSQDSQQSYEEHIGENPCYSCNHVGHSTKMHNDIIWDSVMQTRWTSGRRGWKETLRALGLATVHDVSDVASTLGVDMTGWGPSTDRDRIVDIAEVVSGVKTRWVDGTDLRMIPPKPKQPAWAETLPVGSWQRTYAVKLRAGIHGSSKVTMLPMQMPPMQMMQPQNNMLSSQPQMLTPPETGFAVTANEDGKSLKKRKKRLRDPTKKDQVERVETTPHDRSTGNDAAESSPVTFGMLAQHAKNSQGAVAQWQPPTGVPMGPGSTSQPELAPVNLQHMDSRVKAVENSLFQVQKDVGDLKVGRFRGEAMLSMFLKQGGFDQEEIDKRLAMADQLAAGAHAGQIAETQNGSPGPQNQQIQSPMSPLEQPSSGDV